MSSRTHVLCLNFSQHSWVSEYKQHMTAKPSQAPCQEGLWTPLRNPETHHIWDRSCRVCDLGHFQERAGDVVHNGLLYVGDKRSLYVTLTSPVWGYFWSSVHRELFACWAVEVGDVIRMRSLQLKLGSGSFSCFTCSPTVRFHKCNWDVAGSEPALTFAYRLATVFLWSDRRL